MDDNLIKLYENCINNDEIPNAEKLKILNEKLKNPKAKPEKTNDTDKSSKEKEMHDILSELIRNNIYNSKASAGEFVKENKVFFDNIIKTLKTKKPDSNLQQWPAPNPLDVDIDKASAPEPKSEPTEKSDNTDKDTQSEQKSEPTEKSDNTAKAPSPEPKAKPKEYDWKAAGETNAKMLLMGLNQWFSSTNKETAPNNTFMYFDKTSKKLFLGIKNKEGYFVKRSIRLGGTQKVDSLYIRGLNEDTTFRIDKQIGISPKTVTDYTAADLKADLKKLESKKLLDDTYIKSVLDDEEVKDVLVFANKRTNSVVMYLWLSAKETQITPKGT